MRIVQCIPNFGLGGVQKAGCVLSQGMHEAGHSVWVVGQEDGPRFAADSSDHPTHCIARRQDELLTLVDEVQPDVIHIHAAAYDEPLVTALRIRSPDSLLVSTPVFGRPPRHKQTLVNTRTCCVGQYTFFRLCRWLAISGETALHSGIAYAPLTPFEPSRTERAQALGLEFATKLRSGSGSASRIVVVGRLGRQDPGKWSKYTSNLVDALLGMDPCVRWLSIGYPPSLGLADLQRRWGERFLNIGETSDYDILAGALLAMDVQVFFSRQGECFAASICEAAGHRVPTIACANPLRDNGQSEQVIDGVSGYLVSDIPQAIHRVRELIHDHHGLHALRESTFAHALTHWHYRVVSQHVLALYTLWKTPQPASCRAFDLLIAEQRAFSSTYRSRILAMYAERPGRRLLMSFLLKAVEIWPLFRLGGALSRFVRTITRCIRRNKALSSHPSNLGCQ